MAFTEFWLNNKTYWFNSTIEDDAYICKTYGNLLYTKIEDPLEYILINDQLQRHMARYYVDFKPNYDKVLWKCLHWLNLDIDLNYCPVGRVFFLMPLRHTFQKNYIKQAIDRVQEYKLSDPFNKHYKRFFEYSVKCYAKACPAILKDAEQISSFSVFKKICDYWSDLENVSNSFKSLKIPNLFRHLEIHRKILISLSGGVDSMVCSFIMKLLFPGNEIIAMHINYNNRDTSYSEEQFVRHWCIHLNIPCYIRKIDEISRKRNHDRTFYEQITKNIRFNCYKQFDCPVVLGHNKDDTVENIITNICGQTRIYNLKGMVEDGIDREVNLFRPMLTITKQEIYSFSHEHSIPYLYDSTPKWSQRGQIRDSIVPFMNKFDSRFIEGLYKLSETVKTMNSNNLDPNSTKKNEYSYSEIINETWWWKQIIPEARHKAINICIDTINGKHKTKAQYVNKKTIVEFIDDSIRISKT
tara:strand:+ start:10551 stop:11954 length:1404 start_codon:yes stop_codon:yes gene_type:complete